MQGEVRAGSVAGDSTSPAGLADGRVARALLRAALAVVGLAVLTVCAEAAFLGPDVSPSARLLVHASAASSAAFLLYAAQALLRPRLLALRAWEAATAAALVTLGASAVTGPFDTRALLLAGASFLLVTCFGVSLAALRRLVSDPLLATALIAIGLCLATAAPLWLGPLAELSQRASIVNWVIAVSPLTYLSMLADFDYLRTGWFYEHTALGSLRYEYPSAWTVSVVYALPVLAAGGIGLGKRLRRFAP